MSETGEMEQVEILLAEDNPDDAELTLRALRKSKIANRIAWVKDGVEALDFIFGSGNGLPLVVLLDLNMPRMNGIEVLKRLKADERTCMIPVVMMTTSKEERDLLESYRLGVNSYVVKPVDFEKFAEMIGEVGMYWLAVNQFPPQQAA